jgi:hypothetical protein
MATFWNPATFNFAFNQVVSFRVSARNARGWGPTSLPNTQGVAVKTVPKFMNPPQRDPATNDKQIMIFWTHITSEEHTGGSAILSYGLEWDNGSN